jgi:hypothetical protein
MTESERTPATAPEKDRLRPGCSDSAVESGSFHIPLSCSVQALWSAPSAFEQCTEIALAALSSAASVFHPSSGRPDCVAEDAVRGETVSRADLPAICNLQGDFQKLQGAPILLPVKFTNSFKILEELSPNLRSREHFWYCSEGAGSTFLVLQGRAALNCEWWQGWARGWTNTAGPRSTASCGHRCFWFAHSVAPYAATIPIVFNIGDEPVRLGLVRHSRPPPGDRLT